ncbi:MAG: GNAT family N-acetyltransferase [Thermoplasmata archaeon]|nr:GNAT family N-acetyltransferase [Thermoplasmata archaeon]
MNIREANSDDKEQIAKLFSDENDHHYTLQPEIFNNLSAAEILPENWFENILKNDTQFIFVAEIETQLVGLIYFTIHQIDDDLLCKQKNWINIDEMAVQKNYRGKGIGKELLNFVENYAKQLKAGSIRLEVWENNEAAIYFYQSNGFKTKKYQRWKNL